jgi:putative hemolysin
MQSTVVSHITQHPKAQLSVAFANTPEQIQACQRLRFEIFALEMGANLPSADQGLDMDGFDPYCHHLMVIERNTGKIVAYTRILSDITANRIGGFYSDHEFDLKQIRKLDGRVMEIGRTCVHPDYRNGATIGVLWSGLAQFMMEHHFDFLMGCASVSLDNNGAQVLAISDYLQAQDLLTSEDRSVRPRIPLNPCLMTPAEEIEWPPLLKAYLKLGAKVCGEPCVDAEFGVADFFILLDIHDLSPRYMKHFIERSHKFPQAVATNTSLMVA